jgi:L-fuculose-phosphate aldolase
MPRARSSQAKADPREAASRREIVRCYRWMVAHGLTQGASGNLSVRLGTDMLITPSGVAPDALEPHLIARMPLSSDDGSWSGPLKPSTEWRFHRDILNSRPEASAVVHAHSPYATALAIARREIPACHYMTAAFGGDTIRCGGYALFGTQELSDLAIEALRDRNGCLLANHGMITLGPTLDRALWLAVELETLAQQYTLSLAVGGPVLLSEAEIAEARAAFADYGRSSPAPATEAKRKAARR